MVKGMNRFIDRQTAELERLRAETEKLRGELDQARCQLAGCGVAALGYGDRPEPLSREAWGWSQSYADVMRLRKDADAWRGALKSIAGEGCIVKNMGYGTECATDPAVKAPCSPCKAKQALADDGRGEASK